MQIIPSDLVAEAAAVSLVLFVGLVLCVPLVLAMVGTVEGKEARPLDAAVTWMRRHRAQHRRGSRRLKAQWDIQLAHAGGRYEDLPDRDDVPWCVCGFANYSTGPCEVCGRDPETGEFDQDFLDEREADRYDAATFEIFHDMNTEDAPRTSIFDRLSDTDCFAAINWDIHRAVNELAVLQRDLWAGYKLPPWKKWKR